MQSQPNLVLYNTCLTGLTKTTKTQVKVIDILAKIRTEHFLHTCQKCYSSNEVVMIR